MRRPAMVRAILTAVALLCFSGLSACGDEVIRAAVGQPCENDDDCESEFCCLDLCTDPNSDADHDGLSAAWECSFGLDPFRPDSDDDGLSDGAEAGDDLSSPADTDGDGLIDAIESRFIDTDGDCLPDQFDSRDASEPASGAELAGVLCVRPGVCTTGIDSVVADCVEGKVVCDFSEVPGFNPQEWLCDGLDNNCDGSTDEGFYYDGIPAGFVCMGTGQCGPGIVECDETGFMTRCSSNPGGSQDASTPEVCDNVDNDCDGFVDNGLTWNGIPLGQRCDGTGECGVGLVECFEDLTAACSTMSGGSRDQAADESCDGLDNDCDGQTDETWSGDPSTVCEPKGLCSQYPAFLQVGCVDGTLVCDYSQIPGYSGLTELLCDGLDEDCDGEVDEETKFAVVQPGSQPRLPGQSCGVGLCAGGTVVCSDDGLEGLCSTHEFALPETCNGQDDDCDGVVDDGFAMNWVGPPAVAFNSEPQARVSSMLAVVDYSVEDPAGPDDPVAGVYVCGGALSVDGFDLQHHSGDCWRFDFDSRRFFSVPVGPVVESGALVHDRGNGRLLMVGSVAAGRDIGVWAMGNTDNGWSTLAGPLAVGRVMAAGMDPAGRRLLVLVQTESGVSVVKLDLTDMGISQVDVEMNVRPGSFAVFDPSGGFHMVHSCDDVADTAFEHVSSAGTVQAIPVDGGAPCISRGAGVMPLTDRMIVMQGVDRDGNLNGTREFVLSGEAWQHREITQSETQGALILPGLATGGGDVYAFSGMNREGRGLRRMLKLDEATGSWSVESVVTGPSPRAGGVSFVCGQTASAYFIGGWSSEPGGNMPVGDVWRLNLITGTFSQVMHLGDPGTIISARVAIDPSGTSAWIFGGLVEPPSDTVTPSDRLVRFNCETGRFETMAQGSFRPSARYGHSLVHDGESLVLYGGRNDDGYQEDIWTWTMESGWVDRGDFGLRFGHAAFWDPVSMRMLVVGGRPGANLSAWDPESGTMQELLTDIAFNTFESHAWFDEWSQDILFLPNGASSAVSVRLGGDAPSMSQIGGLQKNITQGYAVYDSFGRRGLLVCGNDPEKGTVGTVWQINQSCPR